MDEHAEALNNLDDDQQALELERGIVQATDNSAEEDTPNQLTQDPEGEPNDWDVDNAGESL